MTPNNTHIKTVYIYNGLKTTFRAEYEKAAITNGGGYVATSGFTIKELP